MMTTLDTCIDAVMRLRKALLAVEWVEIGSVSFCPDCGGTKSRGHESDCEIDYALSSTQ